MLVSEKIKKIQKKYSLTKKGKVISRKCGQDHFNARDTGKATRNKRRDCQYKDTANSVDTLKKILSI